MRQTSLLFLVSILLISTFLPFASASVTLSPPFTFITYANNAQFSIASTNTFYRYAINSTHLQLDKSYSFKHYTSYIISVSSPNDVQLTINSWFATVNSSASLTIISPLSTDINITFYSPNLISASVIGAKSYSLTGQTLNITCNTSVNPTIIIYTLVTDTEYNNAPENVEVTITNMDSGNWLFSETKYYTFQAKYWDGNGYFDLNIMKIKFSDGVNIVIVVYNQSSNMFSLESGSSVASIKGSVNVIDSNVIQVNYGIYLKSSIIDSQDVDIYLWCNDTSGASDGWDLMQIDYFNIYNLGGHSTLESSGNAGRIVGGDIFDLYVVNNNSWAEAKITFRNLQHVKMLPMISMKYFAGKQSISYFIDYCVNGEWIEGWGVKITSYGLASGDGIFAQFYAQWYQGGSLIKNDTVYAYYTSATNKTLQLWIDLWFNKANASSTVGGRVNAYYWPMTDESNRWLRWLTGTNWGPWEELKKQSMFFNNLLDAYGNIIYVPQIELMRVRCKLEVSSSILDYTTTLSDYDVFDLTFGSTPLEGVQTPVFDETRVPLMPQGGFLGAVVSVLSRLGKMIVDALVTVGRKLVEVAINGATWIVNGLFGMLGLSITLQDVINTLVNVLAFFGNAMIAFINALNAIFLLMTSVVVNFLAMIGSFVLNLVTFWSMLFAIFTGTSEYVGGVGAFIAQVPMQTITWLAVIFYTVWILDTAATKGLAKAYENAAIPFKILMAILDIGYKIVRFTIELVDKFITWIQGAAQVAKPI